MKVLYFMTILIWLSHTDTGGFYRRSNLELNMKVGCKLMQLLLGLFLMKLQIISTETNRYIYAPLKLWFLVPRNIFWINFDIRFTRKIIVSFHSGSWTGTCSSGQLQSPLALPRLGATPRQLGEVAFALLSTPCSYIYYIYNVYRSASITTIPLPPLSWWWTQATHYR